ncbi:response regulator transcription factor [Pelagovum pacificum]|uniref:Response regulator transcription factor n=1 Tax=Pelagovum pacificum TaxID=2588711 RepID=A0A5C5GBC7_9RHOB|nr:response regulator transcription factor [Pelagovum pacificum]QQA42188.1 response regulator transcription factor [Pelagovum pacificum]TNY31274.1 response regulator transcription factor [Pelagovum pacificum]
MSQTILIVDDDPNIRDVLSIALRQAGFTTVEAADGEAALRAVAEEGPDLVVLDIGLPEKDGLEVCRDLRRDSDVPVLFLTARSDEIDRVLGLEMGGDDYVSKPFSPRELVARVKAILKRSGGALPDHELLKRGLLEVDETRHLTRVAGQPVQLTSREMDILVKLMAKPDHVVARPRLVDSVYGLNVVVSDRTMDSHLRNLRAKLAEAGIEDAIETVHGVGVRMGPCRGA